MKNRWVIVVGVVLIVLAAAFMLLNFRLISSQARADSTVTSIRGGRAVDAPGNPLQATVERRGLVKDAVQARVKRLLQNQGGFGEVRDLNVPVDQMEIGVFYIQTSPVEFFWTPFYARSTYRVAVSYAVNANQPTLQVNGTLTHTDTSLGIMSLPGYEDYLAGKLADWAVEGVRGQMDLADGG